MTASIGLSAIAISEANKARDNSRKSLEKGLPLNQYISCQNITHDGHYLYYCQVISKDKFDQMRHDEYMDNIHFILFLLVISAALIGILKWVSDRIWRW